MRRQLRDERGSGVLEMAIVATALFTLLFGLVTYALVQASDNAGVNAAREGARVASLDVQCADAYPSSSTLDVTACATTPSASFTAIVTSVKRRLGGLVAGTPQVTVACLWGAPSPPANPLDVKPCDASVVPDVDLVRVTVTWTREATNPITHSTTHTDSATMTIQGSGQGSSDPGACLATATVGPTTAALQTSPGPSHLASGTTVTVTVDTNGYCATPLTIGFNTGEAQPSAPMSALPDGTDFSFTIKANDYQWDPGTYLFVVTDSNGNTITFVAQPQLTVTGAQCQFVSAVLSPASVVIAGTASPGLLSQPVTLTLTTTTGCQQISAQFNPGGSAAQSLAMSGSAPTYVLAVPQTLQWSAGLKAFSFTDVTAGAALRNEQAVNLNVSLQCGATVTVNPSPVKRQGSSLKSNVTVTATPAAGADCSGLTVTYTYPGGSSAQPMVLQGSGVYQYTIPSSTNTWTVGTFPMTFASTNSPAVGTSPTPVALTVIN
jgi:Flp pilus assembly protein TadG